MSPNNTKTVDGANNILFRGRPLAKRNSCPNGWALIAKEMARSLAVIATTGRRAYTKLSWLSAPKPLVGSDYSLHVYRP